MLSAEFEAQLNEYRAAAIVCARSPNGACPSCLVLPELEAQFQSAIAQSEVAAVGDSICRLGSNINQAHDTLFSRLPLELCSRIFLLYQRGQKSTLHEEGPERWDRYLSIMSLRSQASLRLQAVCKTWRTIALSTPGLWTDFDIPVTKRLLNMSTEDLDASLALCLSRSGSQMINFRIHLVGNEFTDSDLSALAGPYDKPLPIWEILRLYFHKCEELSITLVLCLIWRLQPEDAPCLKKLRVRNWGFEWTPARRAEADLIFSSLPHSQHLDIFEAGCVKIAWNHATNVHLKQAFPSDLYDLLRNAPRLSELSIAYLNTTTNDTNLFPMHVHSHLSHLSLRSSGSVSRGLPSLFEKLTLPALEFLRIYMAKGSLGSRLPAQELVAFIARSKPPLRNLQLRGLRGPGAGFINLLTSTPALTSLEISDKCYDTRGIDFLLINHLAKTAKDLIDGDDSLPVSQLFLPKLEKFSCRLRGDENSLNWHSVPALFPTHAHGQVQLDIPPSRFRPLHDVTIDVWYWDPDDDSKDENDSDDGEDEVPIDVIDEELIPVFAELHDKGWLTVRNLGKVGNRDFIAESAFYHDYVRMHDGDAEETAE